MINKLFCAIAYNIHDSSVSFGFGDEVILVVEAERVFREKRKRCSESEMEYLIKYGLSHLNKTDDNVEYWSMATLQNPLLFQKETIFDTTTDLPKDPYWKEYRILGKTRNVLVVNHHLAHASTYLMSNFSNATIVSCDGGGDFNEKSNNPEYTAVFKAKNDKIERIQIQNESSFINGKFYGSCSYFLYKQKHCEGKMMALAGFGNFDSNIEKKLETLHPLLNSGNYEDSHQFLRKHFPDVYIHEKGLPNKETLDFVTTVQKFFTDKRVRDIEEVVRNIKTEKMIMCGGVSLNLDTNTEILNNFSDMNHFIAPCCDDTEQSLGALCYLMAEVNEKRPRVNLPYLGIGEKEYQYNRESVEKTSDILLDDGIAILHNGQAEIGPRALGNRSLIARADKVEVKVRLSEEIKQRESYRPVAPVVLEEKVHEYFIGPLKSPYMLYKYDVKEFVKNKIPGAVHIDGSARVQTVNKKDNHYLYDLIKSFGDKTGIYVLLNTSLNLKGDPISNEIENSENIFNQIKGRKILIYNGKIHSTSN